MWNLFFKKAKWIHLAYIGLVAIFPSEMQAQEASEKAIKTALIYNFAKFVQWPASAFADRDAPIILGVLGDDFFGKNIDLLNGRTIRNRKIKVKRFKQAQDLDTCHILLISPSEKKHIGDILKTLAKQNVLTIGDMDIFLQAGGIINFISIGDKICFEINATATKQAGLKISSQLLKLATAVKVN